MIGLSLSEARQAVLEKSPAMAQNEAWIDSATVFLYVDARNLLECCQNGGWHPMDDPGMGDAVVVDVGFAHDALKQFGYIKESVADGRWYPAEDNVIDAEIGYPVYPRVGAGAKDSIRNHLTASTRMPVQASDAVGVPEDARVFGDAAPAWQTEITAKGKQMHVNAGRVAV